MIELTKIEQWIDLDDTLKRVKEQEMELRKEICAEIHQGSTAKGTEIFNAHGYEIKAVNKTNPSLDKEALDSIKDNLNEAANNCLKYEPSLIAKELKNLPDENLLWQVIEEKPAAPTLTIKVKKE